MNIRKLDLTIKEVTIGNKKMTKTIFNQLEFCDCFNEDMKVSGEEIIGRVKDDDIRLLLWVKNGKLRKTSLNSYAVLKDSIERASLEKTEWFWFKPIFL